MALAMAPRAADFTTVREHLVIVQRILKRAEAQAQAIEATENAEACARRGALLEEILDWLEAREELAAMTCAGAAVPLPSGTVPA